MKNPPSSPSPGAALEILQDRIGYRFKDISLLERAMTHSSFAQEHAKAESNQRLEFLGDSVLQILLAEELFHLFPGDREGQLSRNRSLLVSGVFLARLAFEVGLPACLKLGASERSSGGYNRASIIGDAFEALIGAVYLDSDLTAARHIARAIYGDLSLRLEGLTQADNPKGRLQEQIQPVHGNNALRYEVTRVEGRDHAREYEVAVYLHDRLLGQGRGTAKKLAEEEAAQVALQTLSGEGKAE